MKYKIPEAKELNALIHRNHREAHFKKITEKKNNPEALAFAEKVKKALDVIYFRIKSAVVYSKRNCVYYNFSDEKVCQAIVKTFTKKGYTVTTLSSNLQIKISW